MDTIFSATLPIDDQVREIKTNLRGTMNGQVSAAMRNQGLSYRVNFGVDQPYLVGLAAQVPHSAELAAALWRESIRELRLLAPMVMPHEACSEAQALTWVSELNFAEEAQVLSMHLLSHLPFAPSLAARLSQSERQLDRLVAWLVWGRCLMQAARPDAETLDTLFGQLEQELRSEHSDIELKRTALNTLYKLMDLGEAEAARGDALLDALQ